MKMTVFWDDGILKDVSEVHIASIVAPVLKAVSNSETSDIMYQTARRSVFQDNHFSPSSNLYASSSVRYVLILSFRFWIEKSVCWPRENVTGISERAANCSIRLSSHAK
jgi:hypothetical protein